ncbi:ProQ/FINO family protein [Acidithiobacillus thiooxidans]|uniref:ProQ/FINO family protein n=1 Tax=Acidithiobacillus thiooxidans TaxID=930 RepID=UPI0035698DD8|nr:ProQ/FINO family protein [Acidithiobacillus sp.]
MAKWDTVLSLRKTDEGKAAVCRTATPHLRMVSGSSGMQKGQQTQKTQKTQNTSAGMAARKAPIPKEEIRALHRRLCKGDLAHYVPVLGRYLPLSLHIKKSFWKSIPREALDDVLNKAGRRRLLAAVLQFHTRQKAYLEAVAAPGSMRHRLDGRRFEPVYPRHREFAQKTLQKRTLAACRRMSKAQKFGGRPGGKQRKKPAHRSKHHGQKRFF